MALQYILRSLVSSFAQPKFPQNDAIGLQDWGEETDVREQTRQKPKNLPQSDSTVLRLRGDRVGKCRALLTAYAQFTVTMSSARG
jgi:hypothetical protein